MSRLRKELKIRPGFTPQEDVGRFRGPRQLAQEQASSRIPGSNRTRPTPSSTNSGPNPFASTSSNTNTASESKTKAQLKNEKRRASKKVNKNWDESDDDDDEDDGNMADAFKAADEARKRLDANDAKEQKGEKKAPAWKTEDGGKGQISEEGLGMGVDGGGIPDDPVPVETKAEFKDTDKDGDEQGQGTTAILSPPPPGQPASDPAAPTVPTKSSTSASESQNSKSAEPEWRTATTRKPSKPHPIQGGRQGPIGLAHPPPIEPRTNQRGRGRGRGQARGQGPRTGSTRVDSAQQPKPRSDAPTSASSQGNKESEPRVRKEVKVRETGLGSLADRVRGLVISNQSQGDGKKKDKEQEKGKTTTPAPSAAS